MNARDYYDGYADRQVRVGINDRHRAIQAWLDRFGLAPGMDVLEVGCGVGTQTELIARSLRGRGRLLAVDLSPRSVELARARLSGHANVAFLAGDVTELELQDRFNVIVMPDVIEHIPLERHTRLFENVRSWLKEDGWVLIHMPNPFFQDWCRSHRPDLLQVIDQAVHLDTLLRHVEPNGLYVHHLETYAIWVPEGDYQVVLLKVRREKAFTLAALPSSWRTRIVGAARRLVDTLGARGGHPGKRSAGS
jgi:cyclopropane fatty-acyl-phospholipid synthase-like methyltransferase